MKVLGVIRKLGADLTASSGKSHVLFVKEDEKITSYLVDEYIVEGNVPNDNNYENINDSFEEMEIVDNAGGIARNSSREFSRKDTIGNLLSEADIPITFTPSHNATYNG